MIQPSYITLSTKSMHMYISIRRWSEVLGIGPQSFDYTFNAFIVLPEAMASHSPVTVEYPEFIVMPGI